MGDPFAPASETAGTATITHGPFAERVPVAGLTVGAIRRRFRDRYGLPANGLGMLDGSEVADDTVVQEGQVLTFMHRANAKGIGKSKGKDNDNDKSTSKGASVSIEDETVVVRSPDTQESRVPFAKVVAGLMPRWFGDCVWPDGIKIVRELSHGAIVVHQTPARVHNLQWLAEDSAADFGPGAKYRGVRVALPYIILMAVFRIARNGKLQLSSGNECFFANGPLNSVDDPLFYPALLNVSKMPEPLAARPLAWVCSQHLDRAFEKIDDTGERYRRALRELLRHLLEDGFNRSSEHNEGASWFGETVAAKVDERISTVQAWEQATVADPMFATEVKWLPTGMTLRQVMERTTDYMSLDGSRGFSASDVARVAAHAAAHAAAHKAEHRTATAQELPL